MAQNYDSDIQMPPVQGTAVPIGQANFGMPTVSMPPQMAPVAAPGMPMGNQAMMGNQAPQMLPVVAPGVYTPMPPSPGGGMQPHPGAVPLMPMQQQQQQMPAPGQQNMAGGAAIITSPNAPLATGFGNLPAEHKCQYCGHTGPTRVQHQPSLGTHIVALVSCCLCCPAVIIPYVMTDCQQANHSCTNCGQLVGEKVFITK